MSDYPNNPGFYRHAPETSREAAESMADVARSIRARIKEVILAAGATGLNADQIAERLVLNVYQTRARVSELHAANVVAPSGRRSPGASGRDTTIWVAKQFAPPPDGDDPQASFLDAA